MAYNEETPDIGLNADRAIALATTLNDVTGDLSKYLYEWHRDVTGHLAGQSGETIEAFKIRLGLNAIEGDDINLNAPGYYPASAAVATTLSQIAGLLVEYANSVKKLDGTGADALSSGRGGVPSRRPWGE